MFLLLVYIYISAYVSLVPVMYSTLHSIAPGSGSISSCPSLVPSHLPKECLVSCHMHMCVISQNSEKSDTFRLRLCNMTSSSAGCSSASSRRAYLLQSLRPSSLSTVTQAHSSLSLVGQAKSAPSRPRCISSPQNTDLCQVNIVIDNITNEHALKQKININNTQLVHTNLPKNWLQCSFLLTNSLATATMSRLSSSSLLIHGVIAPKKGCEFEPPSPFFYMTRMRTLVQQVPDLPDRLLRPCNTKHIDNSCGPLSP